MVKGQKYDGQNTKLYRVFTIVVSLFRLFIDVISTFHHRGFDLCVCLYGHNVRNSKRPGANLSCSLKKDNSYV
jgi:hypothetical protein